MPKSVFVRELDQIQAAAAVQLKPLGFRKRRRSFNKSLDRDLMHVVTFQMGQFPIGNYVIPGIREDLYGLFAVNLGVFLPCVYRMDYKFPFPKTVMDGHCSIRTRLRHADGSDWFQCVGARTRDLLLRQLEVEGLPFFERFKSYEEVLVYYRSHGNLPFQSAERAALEAAVVNQELGNSSAARQLFLRALGSDHKGFRSYVIEVAQRFGHALG